MKKQSDDMTNEQIKMERSPFHKQRNMKAPRGSGHLQTQVSQDIYEDFMSYARRYNAEHKNDKGLSSKANPLKHLVNEFLNSHALERKCFENLHVIMLLSNPFDYKLRKSAVIGFIDHPEKFTKFDPFNVSSQRRYETGLLYVVDDFNKTIFDMLNLKTFDREVLFNINPSLHDDFDRVRLQLQELYEDIDFDNAFVVMFNLNNYFDVLQDGVYNSEQSKAKHDGVVVLLEPDYKLERLCVRLSWTYHDNKLDIEFHVEDEGFFNLTLSERLPPEVYREYWSISSGLKISDKSKLEINLKQSTQRIADLENALDLERKRNERIQKKLKPLLDRIDELEKN